MNYAVVTTERAAQEIEDTAAWWARERSANQAARWYRGIRTAIETLAVSPERCPMVAEQSTLPYVARELYYGLGSKPTHRIIFTVVRQTVIVLAVRHTSRGELRPEDVS